MNGHITLVTYDNNRNGLALKNEFVVRGNRLQMIGEATKLHFLSGSSIERVSPNSRWIICGKWTNGSTVVPTFVSDAKTGQTRFMGNRQNEMSWTDWSYDGEFVLLRNLSSEEREIIVAHPRSATMATVRLTGRPPIIYCFWQRRTSTDGPSLLIATEERDSRYRLIPRHHVLRFSGSASLYSLTDLDTTTDPLHLLMAALGKPATSAIRKWIESSNSYAYIQTRAPIVISRRNVRAYLVVNEFHKRNLEWAEPDRARILVGTENKVYSRDVAPIDQGSPIRFLQWTSDEHKLFFIKEESFLWFDPLTGEKTTRKIPAGLGSIIQISA